MPVRERARGIVYMSIAKGEFELFVNPVIAEFPFDGGRRIRLILQHKFKQKCKIILRHSKKQMKTKNDENYRGITMKMMVIVTNIERV